jgi:putative ABC transport system substrate-binding protein
MNRRRLLALAPAIVVAGRHAVAQDRSRRRLIGVLTGSNVPSGDALVRRPLLLALAEAGYVIGRNLEVEWRSTSGENARMSALAADLRNLNVEVLVAEGGLAAFTAARAAADRQIVIYSAGDPLGMGLVASLARPGGNVTGVSEASTELTSKRVDMLRQIVPAAQRIAIIWNATDPGMTLRYRVVENAAIQMGLTIDAYGLRALSDIASVVAAMAEHRPEALLIVSDPWTTGLSQGRLIAFANERKVPAMYEWAESVRAGGLVAYGPSLTDQQARAGHFVARLLDGARPADLPMEQPTRFYLTINLRTARAIEISIPPMLLALADEVIE